MLLEISEGESAAEEGVWLGPEALSAAAEVFRGGTMMEKDGDEGLELSDYFLDRLLDHLTTHGAVVPATVVLAELPSAHIGCVDHTEAIERVREVAGPGWMVVDDVPAFTQRRGGVGTSGSQTQMYSAPPG